MRPRLADRTVLDEVDAVGILNGRQPMCDGDRRPALRSNVQCRLHDLLRVGVESGGGLVEQENLRVTEQCTGDSDTFYRILSIST